MVEEFEGFGENKSFRAVSALKNFCELFYNCLLVGKVF